eukprot:jgi/Antlo1/1805/13
MKIHTISHKEMQKERKNDVPRARHCKEKGYHPFLLEREYMKALNAVKIERLLAKPFVSALTYHKEGIVHVTKNHAVDLFASSSFNGQTFVWDLKSNRWISEINTECCPGGLCFSEKGLLLATNNTVLHYDEKFTCVAEKYEAEGRINCLCFHKDLAVGTTGGTHVFDMNKKTVKSLYGTENTFSIAFNAVLEYVLGFGEGKSIVLVDHRVGHEFLRIKTGIKANCIQFSPRHGHVLASGDEDSNLYVHDIRYTNRPMATFSHHVNSVVSLDFSPLGSCIATGSYDKTVRIFNIDERRCEDVYYNQRMYNVNAVRYTNDSQFIVSGSDDGSLRIWKSESSRKLGPLSKRERDALNFSSALKDKFGDVREIQRIKNHRFLPKRLRNQIKISIAQKKALQRKKEKAKAKENNSTY